jgi:hypothetical protein
VSGFVRGETYALIDPERYDDDYGVGYSFAKVADKIPGSHITDCWIVNGHGEIHPGYNTCPVPICFDDVDDDPMRTLRRLSREIG